eukprot:scaffold1422_cov297-Prasinococcus_capsulatus_cf.AAC.12
MTGRLFCCCGRRGRSASWQGSAASFCSATRCFGSCTTTFSACWSRATHASRSASFARASVRASATSALAHVHAWSVRTYMRTLAGCGRLKPRVSLARAEKEDPVRDLLHKFEKDRLGVGDLVLLNWGVHYNDAPTYQRTLGARPAR